MDMSVALAAVAAGALGVAVGFSWARVSALPPLTEEAERALRRLAYDGAVAGDDVEATTRALGALKRRGFVRADARGRWSVTGTGERYLRSWAEDRVEAPVARQRA